MEYQNQWPPEPYHGNALRLSPMQRGRCRIAVVMIFRVLVALLALVMAVLALAGQLVPFCVFTDLKKEKFYSVWQETERKTKKMKTDYDDREDNAGEKLFAVLSVVFAAVACVLSFVFVGLWTKHACERQREAKWCEVVQQGLEEMGAIDQAYATNTTTKTCSNNSSNSYGARGGDEGAWRLASSSRVRSSAYGGYVDFYAHERRRQSVDRNVGIAAFSFLTSAALCCLITVALMAHFYNEEVADDVKEFKGETAGYAVGFGLFVAALVLGVVAFLVLSLPFATGLHLCCPPSVEDVYPPHQRFTSSNSEEKTYKECRGTTFAAADDGEAEAAYHRSTNVYGNNAAAYPVHHISSPPYPYSPTHDPTSGHNVAIRGGGSSNQNSDAPPTLRYEESSNTVKPYLLALHQHGSSADGTAVQPPPALYPLATTASAPAPQPYIPTVVGIYPEALPGPTSMENVTLYHVDSAAPFPATQVASRGSIPSAAPATREGCDDAKKDGGKAKDAFETPVKGGSI
jgi:hypothetical protein